MYKKIKTIAENIKIGHVIMIWLLINLTSAAYTLLYSDEAYYALFARQLALGYFDHPPMIALFIRIGMIFLNNEIGVRIISVLSMSAALYLTYKLADVKKPLLFLAAILSIFGLNLLGFMSLPDAPLLFFTVLFLMVYKKFLFQESIINSVMLAFVMAALLYSKYHGILVISFTILSNLNLLKSGRFWLAASLGIIFFLPHLFWQFSHDFVTVFFHIVERTSPQYHFSFTYEYLLGQILYYGPFSGIFIIIAVLRIRQNDKFDRALLWNFWGIIIFFLISSLRGRIEPNWTLPVIVPSLILFLRYSSTQPVFTRWFYCFAAPIIFCIILLRLEFVYPVLNIEIDRIRDLRGHDEFGLEVKAKSDGLPILTNTYQRASLISFYSNEFTSSLNINGRMNQFDLWQSADSLRFRRVAFVNNYLKGGTKIQNPYYDDYKITIIDSLPVMDGISIIARQDRFSVNSCDTFEVAVVLGTKNPKDNYRDAGIFQTRLCAQLVNHERLIKEQVCLAPVDILLSYNNGEHTFKFIAPAEKGKYSIVFFLKTSDLGAWASKETVRISVK
jgi:hypothetical protein